MFGYMDYVRCNEELVIWRKLYKGGGRGGRVPYETAGDARWKLCIQPLKQTNLGVAQAFCDLLKKPKLLKI